MSLVVSDAGTTPGAPRPRASFAQKGAENRKRSVRGSMIRSPGPAPKTPKDRLVQAAEIAAQAKLEHKETGKGASADLGMWPDVSPWRMSVRRVFIESTVLDKVVMFMIFANSIALALEDPAPGASNPKILEVLDIVFYVFYVFELTVKIAALGPWGHPKSYFGYSKTLPSKNASSRPVKTIKISWWGILDLTVVISGTLTLLLPLLLGNGSGGESGPLAALRSFRLLRPLKAVSVLSEMRVLMKSILQSLPRLGDMLLLFTMFLTMFGIMAVQLFKGIMHNRCYPNTSLFGPSPALHHVRPSSGEVSRVCSNATDTIKGFYCSWGLTCVSGSDNIEGRGKSHFDNLGASVLSLTVSVTKEGWTTMMYGTMDGTNQFASVFFVVVTFVGAFCIINLTIVIVNNVFDYNVAYEEAKRKLTDASARPLPETFYPVGETPLDTIVWPASRDATALSRAQRKLIHIVTSQTYEILLLIVILGNVFSLALWHHGMSDNLLDAVLWLNLLFAICFILDVSLKMALLGIRPYLSVNWNIFDMTIALIGVVHVGFENPFYHSGSGSVKVLQVIRSLQVMRVLKVVVQFPRLKRWARVFMESLRSAFTLTALLSLIIFIYALVGMQLFAGRFCDLPYEDASDPATMPGIPGWSYYTSSKNATAPTTLATKKKVCMRASFDNVFTAALSLFQILSGEDWQLIMYNGMAARGDYAALYFLSWYFIGNSLLLNLFVSILISRVTSIKEEDNGITRIAAEWREERQAALETTGKPLSTFAKAKGALLNGYNRAKEATDKLTESSKILPLRERMRRVVSSTAMEIVVVLVIVLSCIVLMLGDPLLAPDAELSVTLGKIDLANTIVFCVEALMKVLAYGFILGPDTYLRRDGWNILDFIIAVTSLLSVVFASTLSNLKILRAVRVLRPLRFINKFSGLKLVLASLWLAIPALGMVMVLGALGWLVFAILGVQLFSGSFYACTKDSWGDLTSFYPNKTACLLAQDPATGLPRWIAADTNFDNIFHAFLSLFEIASLEGWVEIMYMGMDSVSHTEAPRENARPMVALYFVWFVLLGAYFVVNLFISALVDAFQEQRQHENEGGPSLMSEEQKGWVAIQQALMRHVRTPIQKSGLQGVRLLCTRVVTSKAFEMFINCCIFLNVAVLGAEHYGEPGWWSEFSEVCNYLLVGIFCVEAGMKIKSYTAASYFRSTLNRFDFFICATSIIGIIITAASSSSVGGIASVFRALRLLRLLRLVHAAKGVQSLIQTLFLTIPTIVNIMSVMLLIFFCYAVLGVFLFGKVKEGNTLNGRATFRDFPSALLLLLRIATGEAWPGLMHDTAVRPPFCTDRIDDCGSVVYSYLYFTSFVIVETYVILNLFIAVLLDSFEDVVANDVIDQHLSGNDLDNFFEVWREYDPLQSCLLPVEDVPSFIKDLGPPLGAESREESTYHIVKRYLAPMQEAEISNGMISQEGLLTHLCLLSYEKTTGVVLDAKMKRDMAARLSESYKLGKKQGPAVETSHLKDNTVVLNQAAMMVQTMWRGRVARARFRRLIHNEAEKQALSLTDPDDIKTPVKQTPSNPSNPLSAKYKRDDNPLSPSSTNALDEAISLASIGSLDPSDYLLFQPADKPKPRFPVHRPMRPPRTRRTPRSLSGSSSFGVGSSVNLTPVSPTSNPLVLAIKDPVNGGAPELRNTIITDEELVSLL